MKLKTSEVTRWRDIPGFDRRYAASEDGEVCNQETATMRRPQRHRDGYFLLSLNADGKRFQSSLHDWVARTWLGPCPEALEVHHIDHDKHNCAVANLTYVTHQQNVQHAWDDGHHTAPVVRSPRRLTEDHVREIRATTAYAGVIDDLAERFNVKRSTIINARYRSSWKKVT